MGFHKSCVLREGGVAWSGARRGGGGGGVRGQASAVVSP